MFVLTLILAPLLLCRPGFAEQADSETTTTYGPPRQLAVLEQEEILESSGLAASLRHAGVFWTHNDSGDGPRIFGFDRQGRNWGVLHLPEVVALDWEDMATVEIRRQPCLLLGDIGDNARARPECLIHVVQEPRHPQAALLRRMTLRFHYEDGAQNCEALACDATSNTILLVTKAALGGNIYSLPLPAAEPSERLTARRIGRTDLPLVTAMDVTRDGRRAVLLTYGHAYEFRRGPGESWTTAFERSPVEIHLPARRQGESICYGADGRSLYLTSEGLPTPFWELPGTTP